MTLGLPCTPSRRDRKRAETRERIHEAAMFLIGEHGFDQVTIEMITERADVAKGTFFNYFASKEAVVEDFFQSQMERATDAIEDTFESERPLKPWDLIVKVIHIIADRDTRTKNLTLALLALSLTNPEVRAACCKVSDNGRETGRFMIEQAQAAGDIRSDLSPDEVSNLIISSYFAVLRDWACDMTETDDIHIELDRRLKLIHEGLRP
jgi:AcrR family transcriptional regulator